MYNPNPIYNREYYAKYFPESYQNIKENDEYLFYIKGEERFNRKYRPTSLNHFDYLSDKISTKIQKDRFKDKVPITFLNNNYNGISQPLDNYYFNRKYNQYNDFYQHNYGHYSKYYNSNGFAYRMPTKYTIKLGQYEKPPIQEKYLISNENPGRAHFKRRPADRRPHPEGGFLHQFSDRRGTDGRDGARVCPHFQVQRRDKSPDGGNVRTASGVCCSKASGRSAPAVCEKV